ncbi:hypothetical protein FQN53_005571 [Emmonsiellopsis sp. PD_33]|nr:hypothetical protein FQN53_005571 [Emmonsiellopsis sp. PD_33]
MGLRFGPSNPSKRSSLGDISDGEDPSSSTDADGRQKYQRLSQETDIPLGKQTISEWTIGWLTPALMFASYGIALIIAVAHIVLFVCLKGKPADGPNRVAHQSYVITASNFLANGFGAFLRASLAFAFTQYLWRILRNSALKVSTIDTLFCLRFNPFLLLDGAAIRGAPILVCIAALIWSVQVIIAFPPGALTVEPSPDAVSVSKAVVPSFNASFMGNGSGADAAIMSLDSLWTLKGSDEIFPSSTLLGLYPPSLQRLAVSVMVNGRPNDMVSPCGANCSYTLKFEGPYVKCTSSVRENFNYTYGNGVLPRIYEGILERPYPKASDVTPKHSEYHFNTTTLSNPSAFFPDDFTVAVTSETHICKPLRAMYTMNNTYVNNIRNLHISATPIERLVHLNPDGVSVPGFSTSASGAVEAANGGPGYGDLPCKWSEYALSWYRDLNLMNIIGATFVPLVGGYTASPHDPKTQLSLSASLSAGPEVLYDLQWADNGKNETALGAENSTVIAYTRFNSAFGQHSNDAKAQAIHAQLISFPTLSFKVTEDLLNSALMNVTTSLINAYGRWETSTDVTNRESINVYVLSRPINLYLPYGLGLLLALPFILLGGLALRHNGVSARDHGFVQLVTTTTASSKLNTAAAGGCLGGYENMPRQLMDMKIRFGEIVDQSADGSSVVRRAGFGAEDEVVPLQRGVKYGISG